MYREREMYIYTYLYIYIYTGKQLRQRKVGGAEMRGARERDKKY